MQYDLQIEDVSPIRRRLVFTVPADLVNSELDLAYKSLRRRARLPGFRPGKAPRRVLEARFGKQVQSDVGSKLMQQAFSQAAQDLDLAGPPAVEDQGDIKAGAELTFAIGVDVKPEIEIDGYTGLQVEYVAAEVGEADVDATVARLLQGQARIAEVTEDRPVQAGDRVLASVKLEADGEVLADEAGTMVLTQGERYYPGIEALLIGAAKGDSKTATVTIGESSQYEHLRGKEVDATVEVLSMQALSVPELDDDLAGEMGYEGGVEGMKTALRMRLQEQADESSRTQARVAILQKLVDANTFDVPQAMVDEQLEALVEELKVRKAYGGADPRSIRFSDAEMADLRQRALFAARASVILATVARLEGIEASDEDIDAKIEEIAGSRGQNASQIRAYLQREQAFGVLRARILEEKTLEWLLERAELTTVAPTEGAPADAADAAAPAAAEATADEAPAAEAAAEEESAAAESAVAEAAAPTWNAKMKKDELLAVARELGLDVTTKMKKAEIIDALKNA